MVGSIVFNYRYIKGLQKV